MTGMGFSGAVITPRKPLSENFITVESQPSCGSLLKNAQYCKTFSRELSYILCRLNCFIAASEQRVVSRGWSNPLSFSFHI
ncbi:hypothetical protein Rcae01_00791 [Novipirellula caenicola]|uniref:Uncharacterized protein n=1 Tax=Novipirellula caenicola TaxID=1536901 RepID=A0ABP9VJG7_9BACT